MIKIGKFNTLRVVKSVDFGVYLDGSEAGEILLPAKAVPEGCEQGDEVDVFIYRDSADRLIATTEVPYVQVGEFAFMHVSQTNATGAWLDWGLPGKDLLVPFSEQKARMRAGGDYLVYVYLDDASGRIVASAKVERFLGNTLPEYRPGDEVECLITGEIPIGYTAIVDNLHQGIFYRNETFTTPQRGETVRAHVCRVRPDGKIDLHMGRTERGRVDGLSQSVLTTLRAAGGHLPLSDKSSPEDIREAFACSKKDFKKAIGALYKARAINITDRGIELV